MCSSSRTEASLSGPLARAGHSLARTGRIVCDRVHQQSLAACDLRTVGPVYCNEHSPTLTNHDHAPDTAARTKSLRSHSARRLPRPHATAGGTGRRHTRSRCAVCPPGERAPLHEESPTSTSEAANSFEDIMTYDNFYEFGTSKEDPARLAGSFRPASWSVTRSDSDPRRARSMSPSRQ
jgi:hypothetical protein